MNRQEIKDMLKQNGIAFQEVEHPAVFTIEGMQKLNLPDSEAVAKNLFLRDDKKRNYYLVTAVQNRQVNLKELRAAQSLRALSFADEKDLKRLLGLEKGSVTPFGLFNDTDCQVHFFLDRAYAGKTIGIHPNVNTATIFLNADDLVSLVLKHGNPFSYID